MNHAIGMLERCGIPSDHKLKTMAGEAIGLWAKKLNVSLDVITERMEQRIREADLVRELITPWWFSKRMYEFEAVAPPKSIVSKERNYAQFLAEEENARV